jgi:hypothetical protein
MNLFYKVLKTHTLEYVRCRRQVPGKQATPK